MLRVQHEVVVGGSPAEVFDYLAEPANFPAWQEGLLEVKTEGKAALGSTYTEVRTFLGQRAESTFEITEYRPNDRFSVRALSGMWLFEVLHDLAPAGTGTKVEVTFQGETKGRLRLAAPMLEREVRSNLERNLETLKGTIEGGR